jgi:two-component system, OmpR family, sensor histidine kinase KdpD
VGNLDGILMRSLRNFDAGPNSEAMMSERGDPEWRQYLSAVGLVGLTTALCFAFRPRLQPTDVAMLYLLAVVAVASWYRQGVAILATVLSISAFDFVFVPPYYTFDVHNAAYFLTFGVMLVVALVMSRLTSRIRAQAEDALEREQRTAALYDLSRELTDTEDSRGQLAVTARHLERVAGGEAVLALVDESALGGGASDWPAEGIFDSVAVSVAARWAYEHGESAGSGTTHCAEAEALAVPLRTPARRFGVALVRAEPPSLIDVAERCTIEALADQAAIALERTAWAERHEQARLEIEAEHLRTTLLSSLSHDLRTPLGSIEGAASSLLHEPEALSTEVRRDLVETILEESRRMTRLVANLLDMVRVETGGLAVRKAWQPLEEVLGVALLRLEDRLGAYPVDTQLPDDLPLVAVDELLVEQVFINLLENAAKHTPPGTPITISAWANGADVVVEVADCGPGVPPDAAEAIFRKFYRAQGSAHSGGAGLGLAICRGIVAAHGGQIWMEPRRGGGAAFRFTLPLQGPPKADLPAAFPEQ